MQKFLLIPWLLMVGMSLFALTLVTQVSVGSFGAVLSVFFQWMIEAWACSAIAYLVLWWVMRKQDGLTLKLNIGENICGVLYVMIGTATVRMGLAYLMGGYAAMNPESGLQVVLFLAVPITVAFISIKFAILRSNNIEIDEKEAVENYTSCHTIKVKPHPNSSPANTESSKINIAIEKQILIWHQVCLIGVDLDLLKQPRPMVGAILFFIGSIDNLCQTNNIDDKSFAKLAIELLGKIGFRKDVTEPILRNFYTQQTKSKFALKANIAGGKKLNEFLSGKNELAPLAFEAFVREWAENPKLDQEDLFLFQEEKASTTLTPVKNKPTLEAQRANREKLEKEQRRLILESKTDPIEDFGKILKEHPNFFPEIIKKDGYNLVQNKDRPEMWTFKKGTSVKHVYNLHDLRSEIVRIIEKTRDNY